MIKIRNVQDLFDNNVTVTSIPDARLFEIWIQEVDYILLDLDNLLLTDVDGNDIMSMKVKLIEEV